MSQQANTLSCSGHSHLPGNTGGHQTGTGHSPACHQTAAILLDLNSILSPLEVQSDITGQDGQRLAG